MLERAPAVAGSFYPAHPVLLRQEVERLIAPGKDVPDGEVIALLAPHAGYVFSGAVAGSAFAIVAGQRYDTVILVCPSHREAFNFSSILGDGGYHTPLGFLPLDQELAKQMVSFDSTARLDERGHRLRGAVGEHSLEVQLPFLQVALEGAFRIVPIVMGVQHPATARSLGEAIARAIQNAGKRVLLVASSDLSHFHPDEDARNLDNRVVKAITDYNVDKMWDIVGRGKGEACGVGPIAAVMIAASALGANVALPVKYGTSGDTPHGEPESVVGYFSAVFLRRQGG